MSTKNSFLAILLFKNPSDPLAEVSVKQAKLFNVRKIDDLSDVFVSNLQNNEFLIWNNTQNRWENQTGPTISLSTFADAEYVNDSIKSFKDMPVFISEDGVDTLTGETQYKDYDYVNLTLNHQFQAYPRILPVINTYSIAMHTLKGDFESSGFRREEWDRTAQYGIQYWKNPLDARHWQRRWIPIEDDDLIQTGELVNVNLEYKNNELIEDDNGFVSTKGTFTETNYIGKTLEIDTVDYSKIVDPFAGTSAEGIIGDIDTSYWKVGDYLVKEQEDSGSTKFQTGDTFYMISHGRLPEANTAGGSHHHFLGFGHHWRDGVYTWNEQFDSHTEFLLAEENIVYETSTLDNLGNAIGEMNIIEEQLDGSSQPQRIVEDTKLGSIFHSSGWVKIGDMSDPNFVNGVKKINFPSLTAITDGGSLGTSKNIFLSNANTPLPTTIKYQALASTTSGSGTGATFSLTVKIPSSADATLLDNENPGYYSVGSNIVAFPTVINIVSPGKNYAVGDFIKISHNEWTEDLIFEIAEVGSSTLNFNVTEVMGEIHSEAYRPTLTWRSADGMPITGFPSWHTFSDPNYIKTDVYHFREAAAQDYPDGILMDELMLKSHYEHPDIDTVLLDSELVQIVDKTKMLTQNPAATNFKFVANDNDLFDTLGEVGEMYGVVANTHPFATDNLVLETQSDFDNYGSFNSYGSRSSLKSLYMIPATDMWSKNLYYQVETGRANPSTGNGPHGESWGGHSDYNFIDNINPFTGVDVGNFELKIFNSSYEQYGGTHPSHRIHSRSYGARAPDSIVSEGRFFRDTWGIDLAYYENTSRFPIYELANTHNASEQIRNANGDVIFDKPYPPWEDIIATTQIEQLILLEDGNTNWTELDGLIHVHIGDQISGKTILTWSGSGISYGTYDPLNDIVSQNPSFGIGSYIRILNDSGSEPDPDNPHCIRKIIDIVDLELYQPGQITKGYVLESSGFSAFTNRDADNLTEVGFFKMEAQVLHPDYFNFLSRQTTKTFVGDGSTRQWDIDHTPGNVDVWVNGIYQTPEMPYSHRTVDFAADTNGRIKTIWNKGDQWGGSNLMTFDNAGNNSNSSYGFGTTANWNEVGYNDSYGAGYWSEHNPPAGRASNFEFDPFLYNTKFIPYSHILDHKTWMTAQLEAIPYGEYDYSSAISLESGRNMTQNEISGEPAFSFYFTSWSGTTGNLFGSPVDWNDFHPWTQYHATAINRLPVYRIVGPSPSTSSAPSYYYFEATGSGDNIRKPIYLSGTQISWAANVTYIVDKIYYSDVEYQHLLRAFEYTPRLDDQWAQGGWNGDIITATKLQFHIAPPLGAIIKIRVY